MEEYGLLGLFISSFISSTLLPGGSEVLLSYLVVEAIYPFVLVITVASVGNTLGGIVTFYMGWLLARKLPLKPLENQRYQQVKGYLITYGPICLLLSWLPVVGDPLCFVAGWLKLPQYLSFFFILLGKTLRYLLIGLAMS